MCVCLKSLFYFFTVLVACLHGASPAIVGSDLSDPDLGITLSKPEAWRFQSSREKRSAQKAVTYKNRSWDMAVKQNSFPARIVISKYPEPYTGLNPTLSIDRYPLGEYRFKDGLWVAQRDLGYIYHMLFTPITTVQPPQWVDLAGKKAGYYHTLFDLEVKALPTFRMDWQAWAVSTRLCVLVITAVGPQVGPDYSAADFNAIMRSIKFIQ